ncbi:ATP-dependent helicase [Bradyrhizobium symbiodeficiens]|uniref:DNA 3'-5' helicase II n=1 Tax=Bradyrhizobium symbiodeficiens TaxID=1404367 RepID=A0ABX5VYS8_9BRAD|nr:ATP-dependent helicase [Bradyrhizobium symbiodeficiens]QDF36145.1 ATP-dependent helicase [Bradyrhizobium symbiodeficiens]
MSFLARETIVGLPLGAVCVTACAGSGKTRTATHRLWEVRQRMKDRHGIVALLSFSNVAVDTFRRDYYVLAREKVGSPNSSSVEIETMDGFLTANIIRPHAYRSMQAKRTPYLVQGHEPFLKGQKVYDGSMPHPTASLEVAIDGGEFEFTVNFGYSSVAIQPTEAVKSINRLGAAGAYTHALGRYWAIRTLQEQPFVLRALARRYPTILVDEAQDIGPVHQAILELLIDSGCQLSLIGDKNQGIYDFSGATGMFLGEYGERLGVQSHGLTINYRSVPAIVEVANKLSGRTDTAERTVPSALSGAFYIPYKNAEKDKLQGAFRSMVDTAAIAHADAMILCRSVEWVDKWRGGEKIQGQGAIKAFVNATIFRDKLQRYDDAFRFACAGITSLLADEHGDLVVRIARNDALIDALSLKRMIWKFVRDASLGLPSGSLIADKEWHQLLVKRVRALLRELESKYALRPADNIGNKLAKKALLNRPIIEMPDLASTDLATFHVSTVHQVKGQSIEAVMYVANKEQIRAMLNGTDTELGRIGYVAVTRARNLLVLAVPDTCVGEFEPELVSCGFKKAGT